MRAAVFLLSDANLDDAERSDAVGAQAAELTIEIRLAGEAMALVIAGHLCVHSSRYGSAISPRRGRGAHLCDSRRI